MRPCDLLVENLPLVEKVVVSAGRQRGLKANQIEELHGVVLLRLVEDDYRILAAYRGESSLAGFLRVTIRRLVIDWLRSSWGTRRFSAAAHRAGVAGIQLEKLLHWDGLSFDEACEVLRQNLGIRASREELEAIAAELPTPTDRRPQPLEVLETAGAPADLHRRTPTPEDDLLEDERLAALQQMGRVVQEALDELETIDRLVLRLRFIEELPPRTIADSLSLEVQQVYRKVERLPNKLRRALERRGLEADAIRAFLEGRLPLAGSKPPEPDPS